LTEYGEHIPGYEVTVINERKARAAARVYLAFMFIDFTIRMITQKYAPSLLLRKFVGGVITKEQLKKEKKKKRLTLKKKPNELLKIKRRV